MNALQRSQQSAKSKAAQVAKDEQSEYPAALTETLDQLQAEIDNEEQATGPSDEDVATAVAILQHEMESPEFAAAVLSNLDNHSVEPLDTAESVLGSTEYNRQVAEQQRLRAEAYLRDPQRIAEAISGQTEEKLDITLTCDGCGKPGPEAGMIAARAKQGQRTAGGIGPWHPDCAVKHGAKPYTGRGYTDGHHNTEARRAIIELDAQMVVLNKETDDMTKTKTVTERVAKVKAEKAPKAEKGLGLSTQARLAFVNDSVGKLTVGDVRKGTGDKYDSATRGSLRRLAAAGAIATENEGGKEVFFALATTEAPAV